MDIDDLPLESYVMPDLRNYVYTMPETVPKISVAKGFEKYLVPVQKMMAKQAEDLQENLKDQLHNLCFYGTPQPLLGCRADTVIVDDVWGDSPILDDIERQKHLNNWYRATIGSGWYWESPSFNKRYRRSSTRKKDMPHLNQEHCHLCGAAKKSTITTSFRHETKKKGRFSRATTRSP